MANARKALGLALTGLGVLLFLYAAAVAVAKGHLGSRQAWTPDAVAVLVGWFLLMLGPAIAYGEAPASIKPQQ